MSVVDETFSIFVLISDFFSKWNFSKNGYLNIDEKVLIYWRLWFEKLWKLLLHHKSSYVNKFYSNKFVFYLLSKINNSIVFIVPVVKKWRIWIKGVVAAFTLVVI